MPIERDRFETYEALVLSGQIPESEITRLFREEAKFSAWYRARHFGDMRSSLQVIQGDLEHGVEGRSDTRLGLDSHTALAGKGKN